MKAPHPPLDGITVLTLEQAVSAPLCTRHLADLGARVIKIEHPAGGDSARHYDGAVRGLAAHFVWLNHGKESVALDLGVAEDRALFTGLLELTDVVVSNLAPGALGRLGLSPAGLVEEHPRLIVVDISGYGTGGPLDHKRAYDLLVQSEGGSCAITGRPGEPAKSGIPIADVGTALYAFSAVLTALYDRERTGRGTVVSVAMLDVIGEMMGFALNQVLHAGAEPEPVGMGSPMVAPYGAYPTADGHTVVLGTTSDREWRRLASDLLCRPDLAADPRFVRNADRVRLRDELDAVLRAWCAERDLADIQRRADEAGIGNARLNGVRDLARHPQLADRKRWREVDSPVGGVPALLPPVISPDWNVRAGRVPALGADTDAVRAEVAAATGCTPETQPSPATTRRESRR
ncbi:CaiB/BaiF CoA transferase family protein [Saccharopolyspora phatthalungensis]|uniref:Crotonobetainyl-CoA:carnitine CoA-transferase CaiB-like acyl-CoA transferase n=1 Tax=Saccharopolyspora phatthalungensis TaxID=664693 RepID=A0A840QFR4_9PSEU|nr:CoA transferase [Saccharopolyspora phatthalungensis]MBB5157325.1 crotonobetainyl-CoA:carnitine CoA-transferase CaiB-like acyl-CoA transferase [Saccharopolyspora phatthalungensis]